MKNSRRLVSRCLRLGHAISWTLYVLDADGIAIELSVDGDPAIWKEDTQAVAMVKPLAV